MIVLFVFFAVRLLFFGFVHPWDPETEKAIVLEKMLWDITILPYPREHHRFAYSTTDVPNTVRTPLYPMFIAGIYSIFGYKPWVVMLFQILSVLCPASC